MGELLEIGQLENGAMPLAAFLKDLEGTNAEQFVKHHGDAFLLLYGGPQGADAPFKASTTAAMGDFKAGTGDAPRPQLDFQVFPVRKTSRSRYSGFIAVGRADTNDIVLPDGSVSRFHAFITQEQARYFVAAAGTKNGTFLNDLPLSLEAGSEPVELTAGSRIRFGSVELTFLRGAELFLMLKRLTRGKK
jgi:pSer/pThr/pTyr-binding forkhead associated (FHA) protein